MISTLIAVLALGPIQTPSSRSAASSTVNPVTLVRRLDGDWATYRFADLGLQCDLPAKPALQILEPGEKPNPDEINYECDTTYETIEVGIYRPNVNPKVNLDTLADVIIGRSLISDSEARMEQLKPIAIFGLTGKLIKRTELKGTDQNPAQATWILVAFDSHVAYCISASGAVENANTKVVLDRIVKSAKRL